MIVGVAIWGTFSLIATFMPVSKTLLYVNWLNCKAANFLSCSMFFLLQLKLHIELFVLITLCCTMQYLYLLLYTFEKYLILKSTLYNLTSRKLRIQNVRFRKYTTQSIPRIYSLYNSSFCNHIFIILNVMFMFQGLLVISVNESRHWLWRGWFQFHRPCCLG